MNMETLAYPCSLTMAILGIYLNLCFLRSTHRSTVFPRFSCRNLRFISFSHIFFAFSNVIFTAAVWGSKTNRTKKSEAFFSSALCVTRAFPINTVFWVTVERVMFNRAAILRESSKFEYIVAFRFLQVVSSVIGELIIKNVFEPNLNITINSTIDIDPNDYAYYFSTSLQLNDYFEYYHGILIILPVSVLLIIIQAARSSIKRASLLSGVRNDQKIQSLKGQVAFFLHSYVPLVVAFIGNLGLQVGIKSVMQIDDPSFDIVHIAARSFVPIIYPLSLIVFHGNLRIDFLANILICRKTRNIHKESKVKVIATRESQELIIANLKMIGILSDVEHLPQVAVSTTPGAQNSHSQPKKHSVGSNQMARIPTPSAISKDPISLTSTTSATAKKIGISPNKNNENAGSIFQTRKKPNSFPSIE